MFASRDVGNAAEQIKQCKLNKRAGSTEVNAGLSTKRLQYRLMSFAIFCVQYRMFPPVGHGRTTGGPPVAIANSADAHLRVPPVGLR